MASGYLLRQVQRQEALAAKSCACGHTVGEHRERGYVWVTCVDGTVKELPRKGHKAGRFFCTVEGCDCWIAP